MRQSFPNLHLDAPRSRILRLHCLSSQWAVQLIFGKAAGPPFYSPARSDDQIAAIRPTGRSFLPASTSVVMLSSRLSEARLLASIQREKVQASP